MEITRIEPFLEYYEKVRQRTRRLLDLVPDDRWDHSPIPGKFSFADLVRHVAAIERFMYAENVQGKPSLYRGCGKDLADGKDSLFGFFDRCHVESMAIFASLTPEALRSKCNTPAGTPITVWKWLRLLPEHEIHHRGQFYLYLAMVGAPTPPLYGMTSEQVATASSARSAPGREEAVAPKGAEPRESGRPPRAEPSAHRRGGGAPRRLSRSAGSEPSEERGEP